MERPVGAPSTAPVYVILSDGRKGSSPDNSPAHYRIEQLPSGFTTGELADQLSQSAQEAGGHLRMLVRLRSEHGCAVSKSHGALLQAIALLHCAFGGWGAFILYP